MLNKALHDRVVIRDLYSDIDAWYLVFCDYVFGKAEGGIEIIIQNECGILNSFENT